MAERFFYLVVVLIFLSCGEFFGQSNVEKIFKKEAPLYFGKYTSDFWQNNVKLSASLKAHTIYNVAYNSTILPLKPISNILLVNVLQQNSFQQPLSFFCRKEWQFEKATSIPLRIRLGSLEYTDYLEQKPNATRRE